MSEALFEYLEDGPSAFPADWPYHGRSSGYRYGCRCELCREKHLREREVSSARARFGDWRTCGRCKQRYDRRADPTAGTKYCGQCRSSGVAYSIPLKSSQQGICISCTSICSARGRRIVVCSECRARLPEHVWNQLKLHHASVEFVLKVLDDPMCDSCGADLTGRPKGARGKYRSAMNLDHDHSCCSRQVSCGKCLRGILCSGCNQGIGYFHESIERLELAAEYLRRVK